MMSKHRTWRKIFLGNLKDICLMLALFFNPFGFDVLFKMVMNWTGSYWITDVIFYSLAGLFFGFYLYFRRLSKEKIVI